MMNRALAVAITLASTSSAASAGTITILETRYGWSGYAKTSSTLDGATNEDQWHEDSFSLPSTPIHFSRSASFTDGESSNPAFASAHASTDADLDAIFAGNSLQLSGAFASSSGATANAFGFADAGSSAYVAISFRIESYCHFAWQVDASGAGAVGLFGDENAPYFDSASGLLGPGQYQVQFVAVTQDLINPSQTGSPGTSASTSGGSFGLQVEEIAVAPLPPAAWGGIALLGGCGLCRFRRPEFIQR